MTVSDTRTEETDTNGQYLASQIQTLGHNLTSYHIIKDEPSLVEELVEKLVRTEVQVIRLNGGTGLSRRDTTFDVLSRKYEKQIPGFGELFRWLSYDQVGASAMLSRASAGVYQGKMIISTPGSNAAVQLAWEKLIAPELQHLAWELQR